jgi:uncharacterized protein YhbP (UPF0306 family)
VWRVADPKITLASVASMIVGATAAGHAGPIAWGWLALTVLGIFAIEAAKNASGEIFDWDSGTDAAVTEAERSPFSGGKRVLVDGLMTRRQTAIMAAAFYAIGIAAGLAIVLGREPRVIWLGMIGVGLAYFYHAPPLALAYRGLGELAVALAYGPVIAVGTYLVQRQAIDAAALWASLPLGLAIAGFLWINEFPTRAPTPTPASARWWCAWVAAAPPAGSPRSRPRRSPRCCCCRWPACRGRVIGGVIGAPLGLRAARRLLRFPRDPGRADPGAGRDARRVRADGRRHRPRLRRRHARLTKEIAMSLTLADRVAAYLDGHTTLNLATTGPAGLWVAAVLYVHEGPQLYFTSVAVTRHGQNLRATGMAAGTINDDCTSWQAMKGLQLEGTVAAVDAVGERTRIAAAYLRRFPFAAALWHGETDAVRIGVDPGTHGFFRLTPTRMYFMDNEHHPQGREEVPVSTALVVPPPAAPPAIIAPR